MSLAHPFRRIALVGATGLRLVLLLALLGGCSERSARWLEDRHLQGCYRVEGHAQAYLTVHGLVATGGATLAQCAEYHGLKRGEVLIVPTPAPIPAQE